MKLRITDYFWAVGKKTKKVKTVYAPLVVGHIKEMDNNSGCRWHIDEVGENFVKVTYIRHDGVTIKDWTIEKGKGEIWRPRSFDGGHEYRLKLVHLF